MEPDGRAMRRDDVLDPFRDWGGLEDGFVVPVLERP